MSKKRRTISKQSLNIVFIIIVVFVGTLIASFAIPPEETVVVSDDGVVRLDGLLRGDQLVTLIKKEMPSAPAAPIESGLYKISVGQDPLPANFTIQFLYDSSALISDGDLQPVLTIMSYDPILLAWRYIPTVVDLSAQQLSAEIPVASNAHFWGYGFKREQQLPYKEEVLLDELISFAPEGAVGFVVVSTLGSDETDFVLVNEQRSKGGCAGAYRMGSSETITTREKEVNGNIYRLTAFWQIGNGCAEEETLMPKA